MCKLVISCGIELQAASRLLVYLMCVGSQNGQILCLKSLQEKLHAVEPVWQFMFILIKFAYHSANLTFG